MTSRPAERAVVLASSSPRRRELLAALGVEFSVVAPDVDETSRAGEPPADYVARIAAAKLAAVTDSTGTLLPGAPLPDPAAGPPPGLSERSNERSLCLLSQTRGSAARRAPLPAGADGGGPLLIAADTTVDLDGSILAKPADLAEARTMLAGLAGRDHLVHTAIALRLGSQLHLEVVTTMVGIAALSTATIEWYVTHESVLDKAGAYAIQGAAAAFVTEVNGSVSNVIGLPLAELVRAAALLGRPLLP